MKKLIQSFLFTVLFLIFLSISMLGSVAPKQLSATAGSYQIAAFDNGFSLFQNSRGKYYTLSPFNDYELYQDKSRSSFITSEEIQNKTFTQNAEKNYVHKLILSFRDYFGKNGETLTFQSNEKKIKYNTTINGNHIHVERSVVFGDSSSTRILGMTLSFQGNDFVYDTKGNLFTYVPSEQVESFNRNSAMNLSANFEFLQIALSDKKVFITNPDVAGVIGIKGRSNQIVRINRDAKLIEVEEVVKPVDGAYTTSFDIYLFESPQEGLMSL